MEQLVAFPFQGNHLGGAQRADLITAKCEELGHKISAEKFLCRPAVRSGHRAGLDRPWGVARLMAFLHGVAHVPQEEDAGQG
ncbi:hypothetical protein E2C01_058956 [Portunus trituberculatus]|uniref:Uncharacterized protein n=1 Tax=Portunus trituberculatus TaxID=210409 RepID=A0A5B7H5J4_PORTR|nr:hypothetical protein [Portunus trituberculatus]